MRTRVVLVVLLLGIVGLVAVWHDGGGDDPGASLQRSGGSAEEFYDQAAKALVSMIGLDVGLVLLHQGAAWKVVARASTGEDSDRTGGRGREFSQTVLNQILADRRTFFQDLGQMRSQESLMSVDAVVAVCVQLGQDFVAVLGVHARLEVAGVAEQLRPVVDDSVAVTVEGQPGVIGGRRPPQPVDSSHTVHIEQNAVFSARKGDAISGPIDQ